MPKPERVYDPMTGALRKGHGEARRNPTRAAMVPMNASRLGVTLGVSERQARAILREQTTIKGRRIA